MAVLLYDFLEREFCIKADTVTPDELLLLGFTEPKIWEQGFAHYAVPTDIVRKKTVQKALMLGFKFRTELDRERWRSNHDFEMYRDAQRELV